MKLHKDGTVEGTPQEIAEYNRLIAEPFDLLRIKEHHPLKPMMTSIDTKAD